MEHKLCPFKFSRVLIWVHKVPKHVCMSKVKCAIDTLLLTDLVSTQCQWCKLVFD